MNPAHLIIYTSRDFYEVPEGSILKYIGHEYQKETKSYKIVLEMIGRPVKNFKKPDIVFV